MHIGCIPLFAGRIPLTQTFKVHLTNDPAMWHCSSLMRDVKSWGTVGAPVAPMGLETVAMDPRHG